MVDIYPLVNLQKTMENHHFQWVNPLFLWPFSIAMLNYQREDGFSKPPASGRVNKARLRPKKLVSTKAWMLGSWWSRRSGSLAMSLSGKCCGLVSTLWVCQNSYWKWPFIVDFHLIFPLKMVMFHCYVMLVYLPEGKPLKESNAESIIPFGSPLKLAPWGHTPPFLDTEWGALKKAYKMDGHKEFAWIQNGRAQSEP